MITGFGQQITGLALPLIAILLLHATPSQMGLLVALQMAPYALFSLPAGVWLDRRSKYPVVLWSQILFPILLASIPLAHAAGWLSMSWLYGVGFLIGTGLVFSGCATQIFVTHLVGRAQLIDAHSKFAATDSATKLLGPGLAGLLIQALSAPFAILIDAAAFMLACCLLWKIQARDQRPPRSNVHPLRDIWNGLTLIRRHPVLWPLAWGIALWQILFNGYMTLQLLYATRELGLSAGTVGMMQMVGGIGVLFSAILLKPLSQRFGTGPTILTGLAGTALAWSLLPMIPGSAPGSPFSAAAYGVVMLIFDCSTMLLIMPYVVLRQNITADQFLGRVTATMRFMTIAAAPLGALGAGWIANVYGVRCGLSVVALGGVGLSWLLIQCSPLKNLRNTGI